jgi:hypothetical protein
MSTEAERLQNSQTLEAIQARINQLRQQEAQFANDTSAAGQAQLQTIRAQLVVERNIRSVEQDRLANHSGLTKELASFAKSYAKLSSVVKNQLQTQSSINNQTSIYKALGEDIAKSKTRESQLTGDALAAEQERGAFMAEINSSLLEQAKATAKAIDDAEGLTEFDKMRRELKETMLELSDEERKRLEDAISSTEQLYKKEERIKAIKEEQKNLYEAAPESLRNGIDFAKKLGDTLKAAGMGAAAFVLLAAVVTTTLASFTKLDEAAEEFRKETGLTNSQTKAIKSDANEIVGEFGNLGVEAKNVFDTVAALKSEFSDVANFSKETTAALTVLNANFGVSAEAAAKVQSQFESIGGLSSETAANVQLQVAQMANLAGVAPAKVFEDIAENAEATSTFFKGDLNALTKNAIQARRLGSSLKEQVSLAEKLLDFESGIEEELVAATFVGGQFNLSQARGLAMAGKTAEAQEEVLRQIQRSGDFRKQDYFTQQQLAKASGMSVEQINKQLNAQDKLSKLSTEERKKAEDAISQGLDITDINADQLAQKTEEFAKQKEIQGSLTNVKNTFDGLTASVGSTFLPLMQGIASIFEFISSNTAGLVGFAGTLVTLFGVIYSIKLRTFILAKQQAFAEARAAGKSVIGAIASIFGGQGKLPIVGAVIAAAMVGALFAAISKGSSAVPTGDLNSPAYGKTQVSTKEGGLFELSPNDDLVAAPGAAAALANASAGGATTGGVAASTPQINLSALSAPLNAMINEIKALRADMASGKIAVYMDTSKVTANISTNVDQGTRNSFNLGSA